jgi:hypothetical protein
MKIMVALLVLGFFCGCSTRSRQSVAIMIAPTNIREVSPERVTDASAALANQLRRRGYSVITDHKSADYIVHTSYQPVPRHPSIAELVEVRMERNPMKDKPLTAHDPLRLNPSITDDISGTGPNGQGFSHY